MSVKSKRCSWKFSFPSFKDLPVAQAMFEIKAEFPNFFFVILRPGYKEPGENCCKTRVFLVVDHMDIVCGIPENG
jgi:hypothetical protein